MEELKKFVKKKMEEKKREIIEEGERERIKLWNEFEEEKREIEKKERKRVEEILRLEEIKRVSKVQMENLDKILKEREKIFNEIVENLKAEVKRAKWEKIFPHLLKEAIERFGEKRGIIKVNKELLDLAKKEVEKEKIDFKVISENEMDKGLIVESGDGKIRVYNTISTRLERAKNEIFEILREFLDA